MTEVSHDVYDGFFFVETAFFWEVADGGVVWRIRLVVDKEISGGGRNEAEEGADGGGFAGAVGAEEAEDFTFFDGEGEVADDGSAVEGHLEVFDVDDVAHAENYNTWKRRFCDSLLQRCVE